MQPTKLASNDTRFPTYLTIRSYFKVQFLIVPIFTTQPPPPHAPHTPYSLSPTRPMIDSRPLDSLSRRGRLICGIVDGEVGVGREEKEEGERTESVKEVEIQTLIARGRWMNAAFLSR